MEYIFFLLSSVLKIFSIGKMVFSKEIERTKEIVYTQVNKYEINRYRRKQIDMTF